MAYEIWWPEVLSFRLTRWCKWDILTHALTKAFRASLGCSASFLLHKGCCAPEDATCPTQLIGMSWNTHRNVPPALWSPTPSMKELLPLSAYSTFTSVNSWAPRCPELAKEEGWRAGQNPQGRYQPREAVSLPHLLPAQLTVIPTFAIRKNITLEQNTAAGGPASYPVGSAPSHCC